MTRPLSSRIAAVAYADNRIDFTHEGSAVVLLPAIQPETNAETSHDQSAQNFDTLVRSCITRKEALITELRHSTLPDKKDIKLSFGSIRRNSSDENLREIVAFAAATPNARYVYQLSVPNHANALFRHSRV